MRYNNYHKHTTYSSIFTPDTHIQPIEYFKRAKELGHNTYFTTEHGFGGDIFETVSLSQQEEFQGIKPIFALEGYIVPNPLEKDNSNYHIMLIARTDNARKKLNKINSRANREGYYYKPRIFLEDLLQLDKDDIYITSACVAGFLRDEIGFKEIFLPLYRHFDKSLLLETQSHNENIQKKHNQNILRIAKEYDLKIIHANDSHYIYPDEAKHRLEYLKGKGITYGEEDNFILDYPDYETIIERYKKQGILNEKQTQQALENTLLFDDCETIKLDNTIKMPNIYPDLTPQERYNKLENIVYNNWKQEKKNIDESKHGEYEDAIRFELDIIKETNEEIHTADYFLLNERIVDIAVNKYNGILTKSGRGCFTEDALVHTRETLKSIKDIKVGDEVITESGVFNKVINTMKYDIEEELVQIKHIYGTDKYNPSICTLDHKILINRDDNISWIQAKDIIKGDYVCVPKINKQNIKSNVVIDLNNYNDFGYDYDDDYIYEYSPYMNNEYEYSPSEMAKKIGIGKSAFEKFANGDKKALSRKKWAKDKFFEITPFKTQKEYVEYINYKRTKKIKRFISIDKEFNKFIGLMYGDGFTHNKGSHTIGLAIHKENNTENEKVFYEIAKRLNLEVYRHDNKTKKLSLLYINSNLITNFIKKELFISKKGEEKQFNTKWFNQTKENLMGLVEGLRLSDGSYLKKRINFDNTSKSLINAYKLLCLMTNEGVNSLSVRPSYTTKEGYDCKESYKLRLNPNAINNQKPSERIKEDDNYWYLPIKEIVFLPKQKVTVYDIEVENEHSYLLNNMIVHNSGVSFFINKLLGFTGVDRLGLNVPMYPTRFLSKTRLLESQSLPDFDFNTANPEPFIKATKDLLGENGCYWMIAYGTMKESEAFRNTCRNMELDHKEYNEIAKNIDTYKDDKKWKDIIKHSEKFVGSIVSASPHPCANVLLDKDIEEEIGVVRIGDKLCAIITSKEADEWKYLKNDYLTVLVVEIINDVFKLIGKDIIPISELISKLDDKVWDLYKNGITCTLNQVDSDFATNLIKKYAPTCYEEISAFVAAIRPGFASLLDTFINRQKYSTGVEALDKILETTEHYMLYQESVMQYLVWLGIPEDITYEIVKKIAKKTLTEEEIEELHNKLLYQWIEKNGSEDGFLESWEVIENNSRYSFNASHSISVALDSLYGAYLKANYPLEYYKVVLDKYRNDLDRTTKLISELPYFNIKLSPIKFRHSGANYTIDKPTNTIYKGVASIKHLNHEVAEQLYELRNNTYNNFYELMLDIKNKVNIRSNQLDILIKLDYFEEFGKAKKLLDYVLYFNSLYDTKVVSKNKFDDTTNDIIAKYSRQTEKQFRDLDNEKILLDIWNRIPNEDLSILEKIDAQKEYLGYVDYANPELDKRYVLVMNLDTRFSPRFNAYCLNNGKTEQIKVYKEPRGRRMNNVTYYSDIPFKEGDILFCKKFNLKPQSRKTENGWEQIPGTLEWWLISYSKINSSAIKT